MGLPWSRSTQEQITRVHADLGISERQDAAWGVFVKTLNTAVELLDDVEDEVALPFAERPPSFPKALDWELTRLSAHAEAMWMLKAITSALYCSLTPHQRERADRFLPTLCGEFVWLNTTMPARRQSPTRSLVTRPSDRQKSQLTA
jgi:LTXXQ motif family protein